MEELCKVLEIEPKTYNPIGPKFVLEKINLRFFIIFNMTSFANA